MHLDLGQQAFLYFSFDPSEHERPQNLVQLSDYLSIFVFYLLLSQIYVLCKIEPLIKVG